MVSVRLPSALVRELDLIGGVEQADRSATVRRLLARDIHDWKLKHYAQQYGDRKLTLARAAGVSLWEMNRLRPPQEGAGAVRTRRPAARLEDHFRRHGYARVWRTPAERAHSDTASHPRKGPPPWLR